MARGTKPHLGIFGRRNNGKSSFINTISGQNISIVSSYAGTTTDPVKKAMEITGIGASIIIDTAGIDDTGELGKQRVKKTYNYIKRVDLAILIITNNEFDEFEEELIKRFNKYEVPFFIVHNKSDISKIETEFKLTIEKKYNTDIIDFSTINPFNLENIIELIRKYLPENAYQNPSIIGDLVSYGDIVMLITPIDVEAPEGRLILPQVQVIRDCLDNDCVALVLKERELEGFFRKNQLKPKIAITDSQVFLKADSSIPKDIPLTSFSILFARYKGPFEKYLEGTPKISELKDNDRVLILESCTHHVSCDDIGRVKVPRWLSNFTGKKLEFDVVSGLNELPLDINEYSIVVQCGGCMLTRKQVMNRLKPAVDAGIPVTNYGMTISYCLGIYNRAIAPIVKLSESSIDYL